MVELSIHPGASVAGSRDPQVKDLAQDPSVATYAAANLKQSQSISMARPSAHILSRQRAASISGSLANDGATYPSESSITSTPKQRKRLSINFALPVVSSAASTTLAPQAGATTGPSAPSTAASSAAPRRGRPSHSHSASVSLPPLPDMIGGPAVAARQPQQQTSSPKSTTPSPQLKHRYSASVSHISNDSGLSTPTSSTSSINNNNLPSSKVSAIEYYFSQLAYRERRVVELRDEIKRMELQLRQAVDDLEEFRKNVPSELAPMSSSVPSGGLSTPRTALSRSNTYSANSISPPSASATARAAQRPFMLDHVAALPDEPRRPLALSSTSSPNSTDQSPRHSNSLSDSSASSADTPGELKHGFMANSSSLGGGLPMPPSRTQHVNPMHPGYPPGAEGTGDDVFHKGRRVAEEIGTQFWSFFDEKKGGPGGPGGPGGEDGLLPVHPMAANPMAGNPMAANMMSQPPPSDTGLPNLAMLQQQHQSQQSTGRSAPMAPPRKPRRKLEQPISEVPMMGLPPMPSNLQRSGSTSRRGPFLGHARHSSMGPMLTSDRAAKGDDNMRPLPESSNKYFLV